MTKRNYNTKQRDFLIAFFKSNAGRCFTIDEVLANAAASGDVIGQTTVYRNLETLAGEGVLLKHAMPSGSGAYFQYLAHGAREPEHYHLLCTQCGGVTHLDCDFLNKLFAHLRREHKFDFDKQKTVFYGHCEKCADGLGFT
jgi:Fur family ferric uptake transcriptional regulator